MSEKRVVGVGKDLAFKALPNYANIFKHLLDLVFGLSYVEVEVLLLKQRGLAGILCKIKAHPT